MASVGLESNRNNAVPIAMAVGTFVLWGLLPVYWKVFSQVPAYEVLAHRVFWSFLFLSGLVLVLGRGADFKREAGALLKCRRRFLSLLLGSVLISCNWLTYIWAVNNDRVVETSLGYYVNPLLNVLIGVTVLRERLSLWQFLAVVLAAIGVIHLTISYGEFPLVSLILAGTMSIYGLAKKVTGLSALVGMTLETALIAPVALIFFGYIYGIGQGYPIGLSPTFLLLAGAGVVTAVPLTMFAHCLNRLPYTMMGIIQYISPTLTLLLGVFVYNETFTKAHGVAFGLIWVGLILFTCSKSAPLVRLEHRWRSSRLSG